MASENELLPSIPVVVVDESIADKDEQKASERALLESRRAVLLQELERLQAPIFRQSHYYRERRACCAKMLALIDASLAELEQGKRPPAGWNVELETLLTALRLD
ncbi:hypothetical protein CCYA_CCYA08G2472 [Cyanidiococcus yangmingshanensis]|nr:hypothetical protein CCYA_CCYA08G2472 [Cyanidiococcus yangmingshanensis]